MPDSDHRRRCRLFHPERRATRCAMTHTHHLNAPLRTTRQSTRRCSSSWAKPELRGLLCVICERQKREGKGGMRVENVSVHGTVCVVCAYQLRSILPPHHLLLLPRCSHRKCYDTLLISLIVRVPSFTHARDSFLLSPLLMTCPYDASSIMQTFLLIQ